MSDSHFSQRLLSWFDQHGRKDLPWQQDRSAYRVWLSEVMLQQTQVKTVIPYFLKFTKRFPTVRGLASASDDEVMALWAGLGYYARARNLHRCAKDVVKSHNGKFPETVEGLEQLPGIGRSTAGAIVAQAYGERGVILDGNVKRVLARYAAIEGWTGTTAVQKQLWQLAEQLTPVDRLADYTQAIMDLGATLCTRRQPRCGDCPLIDNCQAYEQNLTEELPTRKPKKTLPCKHTNMLICDYDGQFLLCKRPPVGIWGGLWSLPEVDRELNDERIQNIISDQFGLKITTMSKGISFRHTFSHYHLDIQPWYIKVDSSTPCVSEPGYEWFARQKLQELGLPKPVASLLISL